MTVIIATLNNETLSRGFIRSPGRNCGRLRRTNAWALTFLICVCFNINAEAATFVINATGDAVDATPGDGICDTGGLNSAGAAECTLRAAIQEANAFAGGDTISFNIPTTEPGYSAAPLSYTIQPASALPSISELVVMDGSTQPDFSGTPIIVLDGLFAGATAHGLVIGATGGGSTIRGLVVQHFVNNGILLLGGSNVIAGNYIGLSADGTTVAANNPSAANQLGGIRVESATNTIGGVTAADRNVLSGNGFTGIDLFGAGATGNMVYGNYIGIDATGTIARGNSQEGIDLELASGNIIGGPLPGQRNILSGNASDGVEIDGGDSNIVQGNYIGTDLTGTVIISNGRDGIDINDNGADGATDNLIGGTGANEGNLIRGNTLYGINVRGAPVINIPKILNHDSERLT